MDMSYGKAMGLPRNSHGQGHQQRMAHAMPSELTNVNGTLFFLATMDPNSYELWKSDGTAAGTVLVKDIRATGGRLAL